MSSQPSQPSQECIKYFLDIANDYRLSLQSDKPLLSSFVVVSVITYRLVDASSPTEKDYEGFVGPDAAAPSSFLYIVGTNSEPCSLTGSICAERSALCQLRVLSHVPANRGSKRVVIHDVYIVTDAEQPITPGVLCREYMMSYAHGSFDLDCVRVVMAGSAGESWIPESLLVSKLPDLYPAASCYSRKNAARVAAEAKNAVLCLDCTPFRAPPQAPPRTTSRAEHFPSLHSLAMSHLESAAPLPPSLAPSVRYAAACLLSSGATLCALEYPALEYGCSLDVVGQLAALLAERERCNKGARETIEALCIVDQFKVCHAPFAVGRAFLKENGYGGATVFYHERRRGGGVSGGNSFFLDLKEILVDDLVPLVPAFREFAAKIAPVQQPSRKGVLVIMRHGERVDYTMRDAGMNWTATAERPWDSPLTEGGMQQARLAGARIRTFLDEHGYPPLSLCYSSPTTRCCQTAAYALSTAAGAAAVDVKVRIEHGLAESCCEDWYRSWCCPGSDSTWGGPNEYRARGGKVLTADNMHPAASLPVRELLARKGPPANCAAEAFDSAERKHIVDVSEFKWGIFESEKQEAQRMKSVAEALAREVGGDTTILLVSHGGPIQHLYDLLVNKRLVGGPCCGYTAFSVYEWEVEVGGGEEVVKWKNVVKDDVEHLGGVHGGSA